MAVKRVGPNSARNDTRSPVLLKGAEEISHRMGYLG
ncbi:hypothetical protein STVIR_8823 [Streptomyces viridochromogenes Tue57]|uniref:Uncharacterized protein n=1 Tax=Streptomyces viridochromogenes Tue57 TaxID=1160705 RepID=L8P4L7_STRVR|nr:hypothetical protein STVIR_8823 [Streptomyces viridochromogenes Tue57]